MSASDVEARETASARYAEDERRWREWINRRIPPARQVTLDQRRIFIFPSRTGLFFMLVMLLMLMLLRTGRGTCDACRGDMGTQTLTQTQRLIMTRVIVMTIMTMMIMRIMAAWLQW